MAGEEKPYDHLPYFYSDILDLSFEVWGDLSAWERTVRRGSLEDSSFAYYYFAEGRLNGVLMVNRPREERKPAQALVRARVAFDEVATQLQDEGVELETLAG